MKSDISLLVFMKETPWTQIAREYFEANFSNLKIVSGNGKGMPDDFSYRIRHEPLEVDWIVSFLSSWIIPPRILNFAKKGSINFHPGPPEYPGTGCYNFAIWDGVEYYGATCHYMAEKVDTGKIIKTKEFRLHGGESIEELKTRTMGCLLEIFFEVMDQIHKGGALWHNGKVWTKKPTTRKDLQKLCDLNYISEVDLDRRLRATYFPGAIDSPYITTVNGKKWRLEPA